ncbi:unnamed protein product [Trichobilharzia regenti]|nr:unnamed protein product [Trichobilharzia regenti]
MGSNSESDLMGFRDNIDAHINPVTNALGLLEVSNFSQNYSYYRLVNCRHWTNTKKELGGSELLRNPSRSIENGPRDISRPDDTTTEESVEKSKVLADWEKGYLFKLQRKGT